MVVTDCQSLQQTLHQALIKRIPMLRSYLDGKIPPRFRAIIAADDVLQEVWIAAHPHAAEMAGETDDAIDKWLVRIAQHKLIDMLRAARTIRRGGAARFVMDSQKRITTYTTLFERLRARNSGPSRDLRTIETAHRVGMSLASLSTDQRRAIEMRFVDGMSHVEIAARLNRTEAAVNSLIFAGLRRLRGLLGEDSGLLST